MVELGCDVHAKRQRRAGFPRLEKLQFSSLSQTGVAASD